MSGFMRGASSTSTSASVEKRVAPFLEEMGMGANALAVAKRVTSAKITFILMCEWNVL